MKKSLIAIWTAAILLCFSACGTQMPPDGDSDSGTGQRQTASSSEGETVMLENDNGTAKEILTYDQRREGSSADTVATPEDFPEAYAYGSGIISDWNQGYASKRMPEPEGNQTVLNTAAEPTEF